MDHTVSSSVHEAVKLSKLKLRPLDIRNSALTIAREHGVDTNGVWLVEQALLMVGSRAGVGMKIGAEAWTRPSVVDEAPASVPHAANSN